MNPGQLREAIEIWERGDRKDKAGYLAPHERKLFTLRARRTAASSREVWEAYAAKTRNVVNFQIRPREGIRPGMWVRHGGMWYEIIAVQPGSWINAPMTIKTTCKEAI